MDSCSLGLVGLDKKKGFCGWDVYGEVLFSGSVKIIKKELTVKKPTAVYTLAVTATIIYRRASLRPAALSGNGVP